MLGGAVAASGFVTSITEIGTLERELAKLSEQVRTALANHNGVLLQANYQVAPTDIGEQIRLNNVHIVGAGQDYKPMIKKVLTTPMVIAAPQNKMHHWEFLFIWAVKEKGSK